MPVNTGFLIRPGCDLVDFPADQFGPGILLHLFCNMPRDTIPRGVTTQERRPMAKRHKMSRSGSSHHFSKHASRTHRRNVVEGVMRGGIRL